MSRQSLTSKQVRFAEEYLVDMNATRAAIRAGYSEKTASRIGPELLGKTWVREAVEVRLAEVTTRNVLHVDWIVHRLMEEAQDFGSRASAAARVRALELLGKYAGMFVERPADSFESRIRQMSDDELWAELRATRAGLHAVELDDDRQVVALAHE
jgi:phage terminase small subunit